MYETTWFVFQDFTAVGHLAESMLRTEFMEYIGQTDYVAVVVTCDTRPVGSMLYHFGARIILVKSLLVAPNHRRKGAGRLLLE